MKLVLDKKEDCCGCTACTNICPTQAIIMMPDNEGFNYPTIKPQLCHNCGLCKQTCAFQNGYDKSRNLVHPDAYGVKHKDLKIRMASRSGGMFTAVSDYILGKQGVIYGVGYKEHFLVTHKRATQKLQRDEFRGSKYVQSELSRTFFNVKNDLQENRWVLFTGTPCQTAGLMMYLSKLNINQDKLILCDIICHGTPSPKVWKDYISYMEEKYKGVISSLDFRNKRIFGWSAHRETLVINNKEIDSTIYTSLFYKHDVLRPACFNCKYTNLNRPSDITFGDFWGIDDITDNFNDNNGISLVLINSEKGRGIFAMVKEDVDYVTCTGTSFIHPNLKEPTKRPITRQQFWEDYQTLRFRQVIKKYAGYTIVGRLKRIIKRFLNKTGLLVYVKNIKNS